MRHNHTEKTPATKAIPEKKRKKEKMTGSKDGLVISFGEMLIDFVPDTAGVSLAESRGFIKAPGGAPANVACAISKLGGNAAFIGKVLNLYNSIPYLIIRIFDYFTLDQTFPTRPIAIADNKYGTLFF